MFRQSDVSAAALKEVELTRNLAILYLMFGSNDPRDTVPPLSKEQRLSKTDALKEVADLNIAQLVSLMSYYSKGIRGDHLRGWRGDASGEEYGYLHYNLLGQLLASGVPAEKSIALIHGCKNIDFGRIHRASAPYWRARQAAASSKKSCLSSRSHSGMFSRTTAPNVQQQNAYCGFKSGFLMGKRF